MCVCSFRTYRHVGIHSACVPVLVAHSELLRLATYHISPYLPPSPPLSPCMSSSILLHHSPLYFSTSSPFSLGPTCGWRRRRRRPSPPSLRHWQNETLVPESLPVLPPLRRRNHCTAPLHRSFPWVVSSFHIRKGETGGGRRAGSLDTDLYQRETLLRQLRFHRSLFFLEKNPWRI